MFAILFSFFVHAQELPVPVIQGDYKVSKTYTVLSHLRWEKVSSLTVEGKERLKQLKREGYACLAAASTIYDCTKHLKDLEPTEALDQALDQRWKNSFFTFYPSVSSPELVTNTDFYKQFLVSQKVVLWEVFHSKEAFVWNPVSYNWTQGIWKVYLGSSSDPNSMYVPFLVETSQIYVTELIDFNQGWVRDRYFVKVELKKIVQ